MELDKGIGIAKWMIGLAAAAGFLVIIAKDGSQLNSFLSGGANTIIAFGKGIGGIA